MAFCTAKTGKPSDLFRLRSLLTLSIGMVFLQLVILLFAVVKPRERILKSHPRSRLLGIMHSAGMAVHGMIAVMTALSVSNLTKDWFPLESTHFPAYTIWRKLTCRILLPPLEKVPLHQTTN